MSFVKLGVPTPRGEESAGGCRFKSTNIPVTGSHPVVLSMDVLTLIPWFPGDDIR
jgi:hypothetical protein